MPTVIPFPQRVIRQSGGSALPDDRTPYETSSGFAHTTGSRYRGLHLVTAASLRESTQERANRIVAQVEQEIAFQVSRQRVLRLQGTAPTPQSHPVIEIETPAGMARRLFATLLSFAKIA